MAYPKYMVCLRHFGIGLVPIFKHQCQHHSPQMLGVNGMPMLTPR